MADRAGALRRDERLGVALPARCRSRSGFTDRVVITDISVHGCRVESLALTLREGDLVVVYPGVIESLCGTVVWARERRAGIEFQHPLYGPVVDHLHREHRDFLAGPQYVTLRENRLAA